MDISVPLASHQVSPDCPLKMFSPSSSRGNSAIFAGTALEQVRLCEDTSENTSLTTSAQETFVTKRARQVTSENKARAVCSSKLEITKNKLLEIKNK